MMRVFFFFTLLALAAVEGRIVRRQVQPCAHDLLPVLNVCPPCKPASCYCADGKELTVEDQFKAQQNKTLPCNVTAENPYGLPARCDCSSSGQGFTFQEVFAELQKQQALLQQQGQQIQPLQEKLQEQILEKQRSSRQTPAAQAPAIASIPAPAPPAPIPAAASPQFAIAAQAPAIASIPAPAPPAPTPAVCPFSILPVLNVCPPCQPTACYCPDGKLLTLEDQAKAEQTRAPVCDTSSPDNPHGLPARCDCQPPGQGFTFQEILGILAQQQQLAASQQLASQQLSAQQLASQQQLSAEQLATQQLSAQQLASQQQLATQQLSAQQLGTQQQFAAQQEQQQQQPQQVQPQQS